MKVREIAEFLGLEPVGNGDAEVVSVADLAIAGPRQLAFFEGSDSAIETDASCLIVPTSFLSQAGQKMHMPDRALIAAPSPKLAFSRVAAILHPKPELLCGIHPGAWIDDTARLADTVSVGMHASIGKGSRVGARTQILPGVRIGDDVSIGEDCVLHPNTVIESGCSIGDRVVLHAGVIIGADGFGYVKEPNGEYIKFPQIGTVVIEENVEIGANSCVDRGALGETRIGAGTKIDNLVQVGHNVNIGRRCVIAAQTGISGSVVIEDDCVIGGQVGFGDHVRVQSGAVIGSQAGILPGKIVRPGVWWGTPIQPLDEYKRQNAHVKGLERLKKEVADIKKRLP